MAANELSPEDIARLLASVAPPIFPDESYKRDNPDLTSIAEWKKSFAIAVLSGLQTDPRFYANGIRLDWLQRLVFSKAEGKRKPTSKDFSKALNAGLGRARVLLLEDPIEDQFCSLIVSQRGNFRIFSGQWEQAGPYTQTLLDAFLALPHSLETERGAEAAFSLLRLSDALAERSGADPLIETGGLPQRDMGVPDVHVLKQLAQRVRFTDAELTKLGIDKDMLKPYFIDPSLYKYVSDRAPGDTPLEFHPICATESGLIVANPTGISLAIRTGLIATARAKGMETALMHRLLRRQEEYTEAASFWPLRDLKLSRPDKYLLRTGICEYAEGRFLQIIQVPATFKRFPESAFGSVIRMDEETSKAIAGYVHGFWRFLADDRVCRSSATVFLLSGWGIGYGFVLPINEDQEPEHWQDLYLSFADVAVLGTCENGKFTDVIRILRQVKLLEAEGFEFMNPNGILNLFGFWRMTDGHLIPEHMLEISPPTNLVMPTDRVLGPRIEAIRKADVRALPLPDGGFRVVQKIEWTEKDPKPIYGSLEDVRQGRLKGAVTAGERVWWIESVAEGDADHAWQYRFWQAIGEWAAAVGPSIVAAFPRSFPPISSNIQVSAPRSSDTKQVVLDALKNEDLQISIEVTPANEEHTSKVIALGDWLPFLQRTANDAEVELTAAFFESIANPAHPISRDRLRDATLSAVKSRDWRWIHSRPADSVIDRLVSRGLVDSFREIPLSAITLSKCGSIWGFRSRKEGLKITGEAPCKAFLTQYRNHILGELIKHIRQFDREKLVILAAESYQSARAEQRSWRRAIRAMRAIGGSKADINAFERQNEINAVQRAAKTICEVAACEAPVSGAATPSRMDLEELFALSLLLFGNGQLFVTMRAGLTEPELKISPAGDLLSDRSVFERTLRPAIEWASKRILDDAASAYDQNSERASSDGKPPWDAGMTKALGAEYGATDIAFVNLQYALLQIAEERGQGVFLVKRSELCFLLNGIRSFPDGDHTALLKRLTLTRRESWNDLSDGLNESDIELSRLDRRFSLINRPLAALDDSSDPIVLVSPVMVSDATLYSLSGLYEGTLNNEFWVSDIAKSYAGARGRAAGEAFEQLVSEKLRERKIEAWARCKLSWALNMKVDAELGDVDVMAISPDRKRVWVIEAKDLRLCRTEAEVASRMSEYRGRMIRGRKGRELPDKMLRHIRRVQFVRKHRDRLCQRLKLNETPQVNGLLIVDSPQPMNFHMLDKLEDGDSVFMGKLSEFKF